MNKVVEEVQCVLEAAEDSCVRDAMEKLIAEVERLEGGWKFHKQCYEDANNERIALEKENEKLRKKYEKIQSSNAQLRTSLDCNRITNEKLKKENEELKTNLAQWEDALPLIKNEDLEPYKFEEGKKEILVQGINRANEIAVIELQTKLAKAEAVINSWEECKKIMDSPDVKRRDLLDSSLNEYYKALKEWEEV